MEAYVPLDTTPVRLDGVCARSGIWVNKVLTVIDSAMIVTQLRQSPVSTPFIRKDSSAGQHKLLNNRYQGLSPTIVHQLDVASFCRRVVQAENPLLGDCMANVIFSPRNHALVNLYDYPNVTELVVWVV